MTDLSVIGSETGLRVSRRLVIPSGELEWRFTASGGPGGQHANRSNTRVELVWNIARSAAPGPRQRARLVARWGEEIRVVASDERSQARNRQVALQRLAERVGDTLQVRAQRLLTAPTEASRVRRLEAKRLRSIRKHERRPPSPDE